MLTALEDQDAILKTLGKDGKDTVFGKDHHLEQVIRSYEDFKQAVPIRDYEAAQTLYQKR